jgi:hypothetical protein
VPGENMRFFRPLMIILSIYFTTVSVLASSLDCQLKENENNELQVQNFHVNSDSNPHGTIYFLNFITFKSLTGFVSLLSKDNKYFAVINVSSEELQIHSSAQYQMVEADQYAGHQLIIPSKSNFISSVQIICQYIK